MALYGDIGSLHLEGIGLALIVVAAGTVAFAARSVRPAIKARPVLNKSEQRLYGLLRRECLATLPRGSMVLAQVNYGEFLSCRDRRTFWSFNAKRADFLVVGPDTTPLAVVEYQGTGHWGSNARARRDANKRDRVKRRILRRANLPLVEVAHNYTTESLSALLKEALAPYFSGPDRDLKMVA